MTFAVLARDGSGAIGMAVSSSSPAVAARCIHLRAGVGGAASQNITDPRLGTALLDALASGQRAEDALSAVVRTTPGVEFRQLMVIDTAGGTASRSGARTLGVHAEASGPQVVAAGNLLGDAGVPAAMVDRYLSSSGEFEERLLAALEAGMEAGGEAGEVRSAGLSVVRDVPWRETDLRVDFQDEPIADLRRLLSVWLPQRDDYVTRALDPSTAPGFGVPGDE